MRGSRTESKQHNKHGNKHHTDDQEIGVLPTELVSYPCRYIVAELHDAEDITVKYRHQYRPRMVVLVSRFRCGRLIQEHIECLDA